MMENFKLNISFEIFPPKTPQGHIEIKDKLSEYAQYNPDFISVTCGANGADTTDNLELCQFIQNELKVDCMAHVTCIDLTPEQAKQKVHDYLAVDVNRILSLRGDLPQNRSYVQHENLKYAKDLKTLIHENFPETLVYVAGYPEGHYQNPNKERDFQYQLEKIKTGTEGVITQLFFDNQSFYDYSERLSANQYQGELIAGIFPVLNSQQVNRIATMCDAKIPSDLGKYLTKYENNPQAMRDYGIEYAVKQIAELAANGHHSFHLYTMNQTQHIHEIMQQLENVGTSSVKVIG